MPTNNGMLDRLQNQIIEGAWNIGAYATLVGTQRQYPKPLVDFYAAYFAGIFLLGSVELLQMHLRGQR